jgi:hypothetical protein
MESFDIYNIKDIRNIIDVYKHSIEDIETHRRKYKNVMEELLDNNIKKDRTQSMKIDSIIRVNDIRSYSFYCRNGDYNILYCDNFYVIIKKDDSLIYIKETIEMFLYILFLSIMVVIILLTLGIFQDHMVSIINRMAPRSSRQEIIYREY